jgi:hypothetical protein
MEGRGGGEAQGVADQKKNNSQVKIFFLKQVGCSITLKSNVFFQKLIRLVTVSI